MAKVTTELQQYGSQLNQTFFLFNSAISNPDNISVETYEKMYLTDETVASGIDYLVTAVMSRIGAYEHENQEIADFINKNFEKMDGNLNLAVQEILSALWAGYSGTEIIYRAEAGKIWLDHLATYHPRTVWFNVDRTTGRLSDKGILQWRINWGAPVDIPTEKCIIYTHQKRFGNYYGTSGLKRVYKNWLLKDALLKSWATALDRFGAPLIGATVPDSDLDDPDNPGNRINAIDYTLRVLSNLNAKTALAFLDGTEVKPLTNATGNIGENFYQAVMYYNKMIYRGLLVPSLVMDEGQRSGSFAMGKAHFDIFQTTIDGIRQNVTEVLLEQLVRRLIDINFGQQDDYGTFADVEQSADDIQIMSDIFDKMVNRGVLDTTDREDFMWMRSKLTAPEREPKPPEELDQQKILKEYQRLTRIPEGGDNNVPLDKGNEGSTQ